MIPTVVLAGGQAKPELEAVIGQTSRALAQVFGKSLLRHVIDALLGAGPQGEPLGPILVAGDLPDSPDYSRISDTGQFTDNLFAGLLRFQDQPFVLIATADLPFLTASVVGRFAQDASELAGRGDVGVVWPIVPLAACYARYPGVKRTSLKLREGVYTGGNLALVQPSLLLGLRDRITAAYAARKSPGRLAHMMGMTIFARLIASQTLAPRLLSIAHLEEGASRLLGGKARALMCDLPELATDLDRPSDFLAVQAKREY